MIREQASARRLVQMLVVAAIALALTPAMAWAANDTLAAGSVSGSDSTEVSKTGKSAFTEQTVLMKVAKSKGMVVPVGQYFIAAAGNTDLIFDVDNGKTVLHKQNGAKGQKWKLKFSYDAQAYIIQNIETKKVLELKNGKLIQAKHQSRKKAQQWQFISYSDGYKIVSATNRALALTVSGKVAKKNAKVNAIKAPASQQQRFWLFAVKNWKKGNALRNGTYTISASTNGKLVTVPNTSIKENRQINVSKKANSLGQIFDINHVSGGYYKIVNVNSNMALTAVGTNIVQKKYKTKGAAAQLWKAEVASDRTVTFTNKATGRVLDFNGKKALNTKASGKASQDWSISPASPGMNSIARRALYKANTRVSHTKYCICVDLTAHDLFLFEQVFTNKSKNKKGPWKLTDSWRVASGMKSSTIETDAYTHHSRREHTGYWCRYWTAVGSAGGGTQYFHSLIYNPGWNGYASQNQLGHSVSAGCIRMANEKAKFIYEKIPDRTAVSRYY